MAGSVSWDDTISAGIPALNAKIHSYLTKTTNYYALRTETYAKSKAPWTDRTGNARSGLAAVGSASGGTGGGGTYTIDFYHQVSYGIWLEVRFGGRFGIIPKTLDVQSKAFFDATAQVVANLMNGGSA